MTYRLISLALLDSSIDPDAGAVAQTVARLLDIQPGGIVRMAGGGNNKLFKVTGDNGECFVAKQYFRQSTNPTSRLDAEFGGLEFLWRNGVTQIAEPLACDRDLGVAVYRHIDGLPANDRMPEADDIGQAVAFLKRLRELAKQPQAQDLPAAAEACFSLDDVLDNLRLRLNRLNKVEPKSPVFEALCALRDNDITSALENMASTARARLGGRPEAALDACWRTLSPSDYGFHNAIRRSDGELVFVDFEYFGWDDPAKTFADFLLHPAMQLSHKNGGIFLSQSLAAFDDPELAERVRTYFPLFGLKWVFIILNEFSPTDWQRRVFSGHDEAKVETHLCGQLDKAKKFLNNALRANKEFPYAA